MFLANIFELPINLVDESADLAKISKIIFAKFLT